MANFSGRSRPTRDCPARSASRNQTNVGCTHRMGCEPNCRVTQRGASGRPFSLRAGRLFLFSRSLNAVPKRAQKWVIDVRWPAAGSRLEAISHSETGEAAFSLIVMRENSFTTRDLCGCGILSRGFVSGIPSTSDDGFPPAIHEAAVRRAICHVTIFRLKPRDYARSRIVECLLAPCRRIAFPAALNTLFELSDGTQDQPNDYAQRVSSGRPAMANARVSWRGLLSDGASCWDFRA